MQSDERLLSLERLLALPATDLAGSLDDAAAIIGEVFGAEKVDAWLYEPSSGQLVVAGYNRTALSRKEIALGLDRLPADADERVAIVFRTGESYITGRAEEDPRIARPFVEQLSVHSMLCAPLEWSDRRRGVMLVSSTRYDAYSPADLDHLQSLARWVSMVAHRSELVEEVTARRRIEEEQQRLWRLFQSAPVFMAAVRGPNHVFTLANDCYQQLVGHRDLVGKTVREALPEVQEQGFITLLDQVYATGKPYVGTEVPVRLARSPGGATEEAYLNFVYQPVRDEVDRVDGIFATGNDVTALVRARRDAESLTAKLRAVLESADVGTLMIGTDLRVQFVNRTTGDLFGVDVGDWVGRDKRELLAGMKERAADPEEFEQRLRYLYEHMEVQAMDEVALTGPTERLLLRFSGPVRASDGTLLGRLETYRDVTAHRRAATEREQLLESERSARTQAERALQARDEFLAIVSHDLQNPLTAIKARVQLLRRRADVLKGTAAAPFVDGLRTMEGTIDQVTQQVNELMDLARLQAGERLQLDTGPADLVELVRAVLEAYEDTLSRHTVRFDPAEPLLVGQWDSSRLRRVIANLVTNASKYSPRGTEIVIRVEVQQQPDGHWAVVSVRDQGIGIPAADLPRIFDRFHRASNVSRSIGGTGLGLASAQHIVALHGGRIEVETQEGRGSTFSVYLPL